MNATQSARPRQRKPRVKPARYVRLVIPPDGIGVGVVRLTVAGKSGEYLLFPVAADYGRGFRVEKIGLESRGEVYHVNLGGENKTCECKGYLKRGHCKHGDGLASLVAAGKL